MQHCVCLPVDRINYIKNYAQNQPLTSSTEYNYFHYFLPDLRQNHAVCFAGDDGNLATSQGQSSSCNSTCANDPSEMCGEWTETDSEVMRLMV